MVNNSDYPEQAARFGLRSFEPDQFQRLMKVLFEQEGFSLQDTEKNDSIDFIATRQSIAFAVQCRYWTRIIGQEEVQSFVGALHDQDLRHGFIVSVEGFAEEAIEFGSHHRIDLMDEPMLMENLEAVNWGSNPAFLSLLRTPEKSCPECGSETILRVALKPHYGGGQIWGCSTFPSCAFKVAVG